MLADAKQNVKSEASEAEINILAQQIKLFYDRKKVGNAAPQPLPQNESQSIEQPQSAIVLFGWETIPSNYPLPFIKRGSECYVANKIYFEKYLSEPKRIFSQEIFGCLSMLMESMTQSEAETFNDINIEHCDKKLVGDHVFKEGDRMSHLDDIKKAIEYFKICKDCLIHNKSENSLFGFLKIDKQSQLSFVWNKGRTLVPLFYFEGQSEYLDAHSIDLTDRWKLNYLKFCSLVQNISKTFYDKNPLKVVDLEDIIKFFPPNTSFELYWPEDWNRNLLTPEAGVAVLHGVRDKVVTPTIQNYIAPANIQVTSSGIVQSQHSTEYLLQTTKQIQGSALAPRFKTVSAPRTQFSVQPQNSTASTRPQFNVTCTAQVSTTAKRQASQSSNSNNAKQQRLNYSQPQSGPRILQNVVIAPIAPRTNLATSPENQVTNVPLGSPQTASSPGLQSTSPCTSPVMQQTDTTPAYRPPQVPYYGRYTQPPVYNTIQRPNGYPSQAPSQYPVQSGYSRNQSQYAVPSQPTRHTPQNQHHVWMVLCQRVNEFLYRCNSTYNRVPEEKDLGTLIHLYMIEAKINQSMFGCVHKAMSIALQDLRKYQLKYLPSSSK